MPPALSDAGSSDDEQAPVQSKTSQPEAKPDPVADDQDDQDDDDDESIADDEYIVEDILKHRFTKDGELEFDVKWVGYDDPKDRTWEPESNLQGAIEILETYFKRIKGRPQPKTGAKRKGRQSAVKPEAADTPTASAKRARKEWSPPQGTWEHDVSHIDTVEESLDNKTGKMARYAYLVWNNQRKTQHPLKHVYQKCPQKMLEYYESHLVFTQNEEMNGEDNLPTTDI